MNHRGTETRRKQEFEQQSNQDTKEEKSAELCGFAPWLLQLFGLSGGVRFLAFIF
jgi:hypothetical protein